MSGAKNAGAQLKAYRKTSGTSGGGGGSGGGGAVESVSGTAWHFQFGAGGNQYDYQFRPDGTILATGAVTYNGTWQQNGRTVTIRFSDGTIETGTINSPGRMSGSNSAGTQFTAYRKTGGGTGGSTGGGGAVESVSGTVWQFRFGRGGSQCDS